MITKLVDINCGKVIGRSQMNPISASLIAGLFLVVAPHSASGQPGPVESPSNIECLEHLEIPAYPPLARAGRFEATQNVKVLLSDQATVRDIQYTLRAIDLKLEVLFRQVADKAFKNSRFSKTCGGKTITMVFHYELSLDERPTFAFEPPNHFFIRSGAVIVNP